MGTATGASDVEEAAEDLLECADLLDRTDDDEEEEWRPSSKTDKMFKF